MSWGECLAWIVLREIPLPKGLLNTHCRQEAWSPLQLPYFWTRRAPTTWSLQIVSKSDCVCSLLFTLLAFQFYKHLLNTAQGPGSILGPGETTKIKKRLSCLHSYREAWQINNQVVLIAERIQGQSVIPARSCGSPEGQVVNSDLRGCWKWHWRMNRTLTDKERGPVYLPLQGTIEKKWQRFFSCFPIVELHV